VAVNAWPEPRFSFPRSESATEHSNTSGKEPREKADLISIAAAVLMGFIALGSEPWWTLNGTTSDQILQVRVSPFYALLEGIALPTTIPSATVIGGLARLLLVTSSILLGLSALRPNAWWRKIVQWFSLSSLTGVFLAFTLLVHASRTAMLNAYGGEIPLLGTQTLYGNILGLDLAQYTNPSLTATFSLPFYLGLLSLAIVGGVELAGTLRGPEELAMASELTRGAKEVHLAPPYQHIWLSSADLDLNPLSRDPDRQTDDQLAVSFEKLNKTLRPGGILKIILPAWAASLSERLLRLVPWTGLNLEKSDVVYRTAGKPENELVFRKPIAKGETEPQQEPENVYESSPPESPLTLALESAEQTAPPAVAAVAEPAWVQPSMTRLEKTILKTSASIITRHKEPVLYRQLLNDVYMELLDRKIEFESARQIENTLLKHAGRELVIIEELDETEAGTKVSRKWWLGDQRIEQDSGRLRGRKLPSVLQFLKKWQRPRPSGYKPKKRKDED